MRLSWSLTSPPCRGFPDLLFVGFRHQNRVIELRRRVFNAGLDVLGLEIGIVGQDFRFRNPRRQEIEHILDADAHAPDAGAAAALLGIEGDSIRVVHGCHLTGWPDFSQVPLWSPIIGPDCQARTSSGRGPASGADDRAKERPDCSVLGP